MFTFGTIPPTSTVVFFEGMVPADAVCARGFTIYNQHTSPSLRGSVENPMDFSGWYWIKGYGGTATFTPYW